NNQRFLSWLFLTSGMLLVVAMFYCMMPGNAFVSFFDEQPGGTFDMLDAIVSASLLKDTFLLYHVPVLIGSFGSASLLLGIVMLYASSIKIEDLSFFGILIGIFLSVYVIGVAMAWFILDGQRPGRATQD
nr:hypothetical protein [Candidatus Sigynarchaeota archaeon]